MKVVGINGSPRLVDFSVRIFDIQEIRLHQRFKGDQIWINQTI